MCAESVDHVYMGCVIHTVNIVCGSGLNAINSVARMIQSGDADLVISGGMESMSNAPFAIMNARYGYTNRQPND
ncbi:MAG: hypothetical protein J6Z08_02380 [Elusimicrobiales bacterium]|nr:hypothetical protein [Elusimicrobiales bacterium]